MFPVSLVSKADLLKQIPEVKLHNYAYHNNGNLRFLGCKHGLGIDDIPTFSNGAAYADLDNDGFPDLIVNNINDEAGIYRNTGVGKSERTESFSENKIQGRQPEPGWIW